MNNSEIKILSSDDFRKMQLLQLEMLVELDRVCRANNIKYSIFGGTLLGAIRHKGYIPWDDDADVVLLREDYEKFKSVSNQLNPDVCFFQDNSTDSNYRWGYGKLRRTGTTYIRAGQEHIKCDTGFFIDVFPFDDVPKSLIGQMMQDFKCFLLRKVAYSEVGKITEKSAGKRFLYSAINKYPIERVFHKMEKMTSRSKNSSPNRVRNLSYTSTGKLFVKNPLPVRYSMPKSWFSDLREYDFEGHKFLGTKDYDAFLTYAYGDYMALPPEDKRDPHAPVSEYDFNGIEPKTIPATLNGFIPCTDDYMKDALLRYLGKDYMYVPYFYSNLTQYDISSEKINVWLDYENGIPNGVYLSYFSCLHFYTRNENYKTERFMEFFKETKLNPNVIFLDESDGKKIKDYFAEKYELNVEFIMKMDAHIKGKKSPIVENAKREDLKEVAAMLLKDNFYSEQYTLEELSNQLTERFDAEYGECFIIRQDGKIVCSYAVNGETDKFYTLGSLGTDPDYRNKGFAIQILNHAWSVLHERGKICIDFIYNDNEKSLALHKKLKAEAFGNIYRFSLKESQKEAL